MAQDRGAPVHRFERLSHLKDFEIDKHQADPRGWQVVGADARTIGVVKDLIVDMRRMIARYLDVELDTSLFDMRDDPRVLVPLERSHRDGEHRRLIVEGLTTERVLDLCDAREQRYTEFWDEWWGVGSAGEGTVPPSAARRTPLAGSPRAIDEARHVSDDQSRRLPPDELRRVLDRMRPGERVHVPFDDEELIVERRPLHDDELVTAHDRATDTLTDVPADGERRGDWADRVEDLRADRDRRAR